jgi:hypothetical protein
MALVTLQQAVDHLLLPIVVDSDPPDPRQADLTLKLAAAEAIVLDYIKAPQATPYLAPGDPGLPILQAAILLELGELWRFRGDDVDGQSSDQDIERGQLSPTITNLLRRFRDPALA